MTTMLKLDNGPGVLVLGYVLGDPWVRSLGHEVDGVPAPWPAAPVLEFRGIDTASVAVLTEGGSRATWTVLEATIAALEAEPDKDVRLTVAGVTWFAGSAVRRA